MAEEIKTTKKEELVEIFVPKGYANDEPNLVIGVNGKNYVLPKGKTSKVPPCVAYEYNRSLRAEALLDEKNDELLKKAQAGI